MITVDSLYKEFPDKILFKHISFKLKDNMRVAIVGQWFREIYIVKNYFKF